VTAFALQRLSDEALSLLDVALRVALSEGSNYIRPEHIAVAIAETRKAAA
jgi:hypothetical protein